MSSDGSDSSITVNVSDISPFEKPMDLETEKMIKPNHSKHVLNL